MINRVVLVGRLTRDVEVRKTQTGISVASFTVACDRRGSKDAQSGQTADFISCVAWRQSADFLGQYARKGALIGVDGHIQTRNYDDKDGKRVYVTEVVADSVRLLGSRNQSESTSDNASAYEPSTDAFDNNFEEISDADFNTGPSLDISSDDLPF
ncbi:MAG: single-stranded DNA-binding protein [Solobacterium sp.]|nr:single-stranded DNA-binding protein [Solobacterium sp.]